MSMVYVKSLETPTVSRREILRYAGVRESTPEIDRLLESCLDEVLPRLSYKLVYATIDIAVGADKVDLGFAEACSSALAKDLRDCKRAILLGATVGIELDRLIARYSLTEPSRAHMLDAIGAERIEALCDAFEEGLRADGMSLRPRFSPGYGDLALELQRDLFARLDCTKHIGLSLNRSLLMSPSKSVTAIIGVLPEA